MKIKVLIAALFCAFFTFGVAAQEKIPYATTNTTKKLEFVDVQFYGLDSVANRFDSLYLEATLDQPKMWTTFHLRMVGDTGVYMANNFVSYSVASGKVVRTGNLLTLKPAFEGTRTITLSSNFQKPKLAIREVSDKVYVGHPCELDTSKVELTNGLVGWTELSPKEFSIFVENDEKWMAALDENAKLYDKWLEGGQKGLEPDLPPYQPAKTLTFAKVGQVLRFKIYDVEYEAILLRP